MFEKKLKYLYNKVLILELTLTLKYSKKNSTFFIAGFQTEFEMIIQTTLVI